jgi:hypothetical protein
MKNNIRISIVNFSLIILLCEHPGYSAEYVYTELIATAWAGNDYGEVVGQGYLYTDSTYIYLGRFKGKTRRGRSINNNSIVVGNTYANNGAFLYYDGHIINLLPPDWSNAGAEDINDNGLVAGSGGDYKGFIYDVNTNSYRTFGNDQWPIVQTHAINDNGDIVGFLNTLNGGTGNG